MRGDDAPAGAAPREGTPITVAVCLAMWGPSYGWLYGWLSSHIGSHSICTVQ